MVFFQIIFCKKQSKKYDGNHLVSSVSFESCVSGDVRNDIYVTLEHGQFEKGSKRAERNVEVAIEVIDGNGKTIPVSTGEIMMIWK